MYYKALQAFRKYGDIQIVYENETGYHSLCICKSISEFVEKIKEFKRNNVIVIDVMS